MKNALALLSACLLAGCYTLADSIVDFRPDYSALPADDMRGVALDIERAIQSGEREPKIEDRGGVVVSTDEVRHAMRSRAARVVLVDDLLDAGYGWEKRDGLLWLRTTKEYKGATTKRERDRHTMLVNSENENRWAIYEGILKASNLPPRSLGALQEIFHEARLQVMANGQLYEDKNGSPTAVGR